MKSCMNWKILLAVLGTIALIALTVACGGSSSELPDEGETAQESPTEAASGTEEAPTPSVADVRSKTPENTLVRLYVDPPTLDPHLTTDATSAQIIIEVFGGLVTIDRDLNIVPDLAERWDISPDRRVYTFHLDPDAVFHDGRRVTAHDVQWSLERATNPLTESPVVDQYLGDIVGVEEKLNGDAKAISGVRVIDDQTIEITIDAPKAYFVLDRENVEADPRRWFREPNGTGPFKLSRYDVGELMVLTRNDDYHLGAPRLDAVEMILSGGTSMLMYENDEIHISGISLADLDRLLDPNNPLNSNLRRAEPTFSVQYIGMNVNEPPLDDPKVRQALNLAIDKQEIATIVLGDLVVPAQGILPPGFPGFNNNLMSYDFDPEEAMRLLEESKYGDDLANIPPITMTTAGSFGANVSLDMEVVLQMWERNLGITAEFQQTEYATFLKDLHKRRFQMFEIGWIADYPDPQNFLDILFHSESSNNHTHYSNSEVDALLEQARTETNEAERIRIYQQVEQLIIDDAPWIPLWYSGEQYVLIKPNVKDYLLPPLYIPRLRYVYLSDE